MAKRKIRDQQEIYYEFFDANLVREYGSLAMGLMMIDISMKERREELLKKQSKEEVDKIFKHAGKGFFQKFQESKDEFDLYNAIYLFQVNKQNKELAKVGDYCFKLLPRKWGVLFVDTSVGFGSKTPIYLEIAASCYLKSEDKKRVRKLAKFCLENILWGFGALLMDEINEPLSNKEKEKYAMLYARKKGYKIAMEILGRTKNLDLISKVGGMAYKNLLETEDEGRFNIVAENAIGCFYACKDWKNVEKVEEIMYVKEQYGLLYDIYWKAQDMIGFKRLYQVAKDNKDDLLSLKCSRRFGDEEKLIKRYLRSKDYRILLDHYKWVNDQGSGHEEKILELLKILIKEKNKLAHEAFDLLNSWHEYDLPENIKKLEKKIPK